jgi:hypothetical protein
MANDTGGNSEDAVVQRRVDPVESEVNYQVLETVAGAEGVEITDLPSIYRRIGNVVDDLFSEPPVSEAQVAVTFTFHGYRITAEQRGTITLRRIDHDIRTVD